MCLYVVRQFTRRAYNAIINIRLKIYGEKMSQLKSEKKIHTCSECNKQKEDIRRKYNSSKCCCSCELIAFHLYAPVI